MDRINEELLYNKLIELYNRTKKTSEPFTFWVRKRGEKLSRFHCGDNYTNVGIVSIGAGSHIPVQIIGFEFTPQTFDTTFLDIEERDPNTPRIILEGKNLGYTLTDVQVDLFIKDIKSNFGNWKYAGTTIDDALINQIHEIYNNFFSHVKIYDAANHTCFYEILKIL